MEVKQIYSLVNDVTKEVLGKSDLILSDLSGVVDLGTALIENDAYDKYVRSLVNHIGKVIFVNRSYKGYAPSVLMDGWEYGSILQKIQSDLPEATENESWELNKGESYDPNIFYGGTAKSKFFNKMITFEVPMSIATKQVKQSFDNAQQLNSFLSMLYNEVEKSMTIKYDGLVMRTIDNMIGETIYSENNSSDTYATKSGSRAINLLYEYKQIKPTTTLTASNCIYDKDFLLYASKRMKDMTVRLKTMSTLFNTGGKNRFTSPDLLKIVMHNEFVSSADYYMQSSTFHDWYTALPSADTVPYWQGSGESYDLSTTTKINVKTSGGHTVELSGILGVMFDRDALGVNNYDRRVTTNYNGKAEFWNNWYKFDCRYFNDLDENFVVFFVA